MSNNFDDPNDLVKPTSHDDLHDIVKPPSVLGEEDPFSGDATNSESPDIDAELEKVGLRGDSDDGPKPLGVDEEVD